MEVPLIPAGTNIGFFIHADGFCDGPHKFYSFKELNPDGKRHIGVYVDFSREILVLGFEDIFDLGDSDYNDGRMKFSCSF